MVERRFIERYAGREKRSLIGIEDTETGMVCVTIEENIILLNKLHEENQQLKRQIGNLEHTRDFCAECCERLEKENEQLKSEIREVRGAYEQLWMRSYDY